LKSISGTSVWLFSIVVFLHSLGPMA